MEKGVKGVKNSPFDKALALLNIIVNDLAMSYCDISGEEEEAVEVEEEEKDI